MLDELRMLAHDDPIWRDELRRYLPLLPEEEKERKQRQKERAARLARWWEDIVAVQPT
jgi:hypothetical protein